MKQPVPEPSAQSLVAYAPASIGNFAAGFDLLGAALAPLDGSLFGDLVQVAVAAVPSFQLEGPHAGALAGDDRPNLVLRARDLFIGALAAKGLACGPFSLRLDKRLPVSSGLGSSAASIVATLVGLQAICGDPLSEGELLELAGRAECMVSGGLHLDNVAPSMRGGLQLMVPGKDGGAATRRLPWPGDLLVAVVHPDWSLPTAQSRGVLPPTLGWAETLTFAGNLAGFVQALQSGDRALLGRCLRDPLVEPHRAHLVPGFIAAKAQAMAAGALGCSLSGSGPSVFAVADSEPRAAAIGQAIQGAFLAAGLASRATLCTLDPEGARILPAGAGHFSSEAQS